MESMLALWVIGCIGLIAHRVYKICSYYIEHGKMCLHDDVRHFLDFRANDLHLGVLLTTLWCVILGTLCAIAYVVCDLIIRYHEIGYGLVIIALLSCAIVLYTKRKRREKVFLDKLNEF
jgi:Flp pilus assembly protein TadB